MMLVGAAAVLMLSVPAEVTSVRNCPSDRAVEVEIGRLGAAPALALTGTTEITALESSMRIVLHGRDGKVLGVREVAAPGTCEERAIVAAVVIVAWLGEWSAGEPPPSSISAAPTAQPSDASSIPTLRALERRVPPPGPSVPTLGAPAAPPAPPPGPSLPTLREPPLPAPLAPPPEGSRPTFLERASGDGGAGGHRVEIAGLVFGVHDGDAGTWGVGTQVDYRFGDGAGGGRSVIARAEGGGERVRPLGPGTAAYRSLRFGAGVALGRASRRVFLDGGIAPEVVRLALRGEGLATPRDATIWGLMLDGRVRLGLRLAPIVPFIFGETGYALTTARLTLDNRPDSVTLARWNLAAGVGLLFSFGPLGG